ncbi:MAG TPA: glycosyltransferase family 4 protein [Pyrinomonadaceae bacterium]|nr:glycosyltransferase family 4 protein [Pyrinomonadaceae bacterium]
MLNQCFYPDVAATGQYLSDLAQGLSERGHRVTVITGDRGYDDPSHHFARRETWRGIKIIRIRSLNLGKEARWRRAVNFASFLFVCSIRLLLLPKFDAVMALTSPPLISFLGALFVQLKGGKLFFWVMDLNPDEAFAAGWLNESSLVARFLTFCLQHSLRVAESIIVLDRFMKQRIVDKGIPEDKVAVVPPWPLTTAVRYDRKGRQAFREHFDLSQKFVVMYAGNHSPCHPLGTLLQAAQKLAAREEIAFCFVGGGSEQKKVRAFAAEHHLNNIVCLPYQPLDELGGVLSAADLHVVVMGEEFVGIVHPCKIYNVLAVGSPFLYIGPEESHIADIARSKRIEDSVHMASHGAAESVAHYITRILERRSPENAGDVCSESLEKAPGDFSRASLMPMMIDILERASTTPTITATAISQSSV